MFRRLLPVCLAAVLVACGGTTDSEAPLAQPAPTVAAKTPVSDVPVSDAPTADDGEPPAPTGIVPAALDFSAPLVGGGTIELGASAGRPVLLWFWAPW